MPTICTSFSIKNNSTGTELKYIAMASTTSSTPLSLSSINIKAPPRLPAQCATPSPQSSSKNTSYCRTNIVVRATGEAPAEVVVVARDTPEPPAELVAGPTETPEIIKTIQETWEKVEDKYAVTSLAVAGGVALWASAGVVSAIDRLPLVPGVLELVGIGYTGWFAYKNLASKPEREALIKKIKDTYNEIIGSG